MNSTNELYELMMDDLISYLNQYDSIEVAGMLQMLALSVYKTVLTPEEYENMVHYIFKNRNEITALNVTTLQ